jgi:GNAT superfamily N-acetyltransferase
MIIYQDIDMRDIFDELKTVIPQHYEELCVTKEFELDPDWDMFARCAEAGLLRTITVRHDSKLIGYMIFFIKPHPHYRTCKTAFDDLYYLRPEYRKGRIGIKMFQYAENVLKGIGVNRIVMGTKIHLDNSKLLGYLGYRLTDKLFTKLL